MLTSLFFSPATASVPDRRRSRELWTAWRKNSDTRSPTVPHWWAPGHRRRGRPHRRDARCLPRRDAVLFGPSDPKPTTTPAARCAPSRSCCGCASRFGVVRQPASRGAVRRAGRPFAARAEVVRGTDFICVRELTGGIYFGRPQDAFDDARLRHLHLHGLGDRTEVLRRRSGWPLAPPQT